MELKGIIKSVLPIQSGKSANGTEWSKATVLVEYGTVQYKNVVAVSNMKKAEEFAKLQPGTFVTMHIQPTSREYNGRYYTEVNCWRWTVYSNNDSQQAAPKQSSPAQEGWEQVMEKPMQGATQPDIAPVDDNNDLPF